MFYQIERLKILHDMKFVHRDIKPDNIIVSKDCPNEIVLIDFGLSTTYIDEATGKHVEQQRKGIFCGNLMFASISALQGRTSSRRDDIEATMYLLTFWLNKHKLPWSK